MAPFINYWFRQCSFKPLINNQLIQKIAMFLTHIEIFMIFRFHILEFWSNRDKKYLKFQHRIQNSISTPQFVLYKFSNINKLCGLWMIILNQFQKRFDRENYGINSSFHEILWRDFDISAIQYFNIHSKRWTDKMPADCM